MIPLTEAELLRMQEIQAKVTNLPWTLEGLRLTPLAGQNGRFCVAASRDWPKLTEWALEARRLLSSVTAMLAELHPPTTDGCVVDETIAEARRLLGE